MRRDRSHANTSALGRVGVTWPWSGQRLNRSLIEGTTEACPFGQGENIGEPRFVREIDDATGLEGIGARRATATAWLRQLAGWANNTSVERAAAKARLFRQ
jgi:hypothetical protein